VWIMSFLQDVTDTRGNEFEEFCLKRELLMGIFEKVGRNHPPFKKLQFQLLYRARIFLPGQKMAQVNFFLISCPAYLICLLYYLIIEWGDKYAKLLA
jgi:hypothetical protein